MIQCYLALGPVRKFKESLSSASVTRNSFYLTHLLTAKVAGNSGCVGTKYFGCTRFAGLLININTLLTKTQKEVHKGTLHGKHLS